MACVTLKRPLEWIDPSMSPESGSSSPTHMIISNSPPHHGLRSPKRMCLQNISSQSTSSPQSTCHFPSSTSAMSAAMVPHHQTTNPFGGNGNSSNATNSFGATTSTGMHSNNFFKPISSSEIADQIQQEMFRLRILRRSSVTAGKTVTVNKHHQIHHSDQGNKSPSTSSESSMGTPSPSSSPQRQQDGGVAGNASALGLNTSSNTADAGDCSNTTTGAAATANKSSQPSSSSSHVPPYNFLSCLIGTGTGSQQPDDDVENYQHSKNQNHSQRSSATAKKCLMMAAANAAAKCNPTTSSSSTNSGKLSKIADNKPLFTFNQVVMIVERLLRDKEESLQREFETILAARLAEQYDQFVKFSYDQIQRRFDSQALPSYLS